MQRFHFQTERGDLIPSVSESEMRMVDQIAVEEYRLGILQMMENAGRNLALLACQMIDDQPGLIAVLAGSGGNGGGGLCSARHLHNHGMEVEIILSREEASFQGAAETQLHILKAAGVKITPMPSPDEILHKADLIIDALIGYSLNGPPTGKTEQLIELANASPTLILSLDLPSGLEASEGTQPGACIKPESILTLALPKTGLRAVEAEIVLGDIGIPPELYQELGFSPPPFPPGEYLLPLQMPLFP